MQLSLDQQFVTADPALQALALHGYAVFTTFAARRAGTAWTLKGWELHLQRLHRDAVALFGIAPDAVAVRDAVRHFLSQSHTDLLLRVTVFPQNFTLAAPERIERLHILVSGRAVSDSPPLRLRAIEATRLFPQHKTGNLLINLSARRQARLAGADDALLCIDGWIMEGAGWNIFFSDGERLITPPLRNLLPGVTRRLLLDAARAAAIEVHETPVHRANAGTYRSAFASNAAFGVVPIAELDDRHFDTACTLLRRMRDLYAAIPADAV